MQITKEQIVQIMENNHDFLIDSMGYNSKCLLKEDWERVADEILTLLQSNDAVQPNGSKPPVSGRSEQLVCEYCNEDNKPTCCDKCLENMVNAVQKAN